MYVSDRHVSVGNGFDVQQGEELETHEAVSGGQTDTNNMLRTKVPLDAREWFSSLSEDDRIVALAFVDQSFLASIFQGVTTPSSGVPKPTTDGHSGKGEYLLNVGDSSLNRRGWEDPMRTHTFLKCEGSTLSLVFVHPIFLLNAASRHSEVTVCLWLTDNHSLLCLYLSLQSLSIGWLRFPLISLSQRRPLFHRIPI